MPVPANIPGAPIVHTDYESLQGSKGTKLSIPMEVLQLVLKTVVGIIDDEEVECFSHWMNYRGFYNFTDICEDLCHISDDIHDYDEYRVNGRKYSLKFSTMNKIELFINWMSERIINGSFKLYDEFLTCLTGEQFIDFRQEDMKRLSNSRSPHNEPHTPMTTFTGHTKPSATSESQTALTNFKRGTKRDASAYPIFKNDLYYDTFQRTFLAVIEAQELYDVVDSDFDPDDGDYYEQELFQENNFLFILYWLQTRGENWSRNLKEMQDPSFQGFIITILSPMLHNMKLSL